jgi:3-dehydroquinate synthase
VREITLKVAGGGSRILIEAGLLSRLHEVLPRFESARGAVIVDGHLRRAAGRVVKELGEAGLVALPFVVPPGERSKSLSTAEKLLRGLARERLERASPVFAFGGGMVGDLAGFVASTYLRGVPFVQIPTTLLAQVDASIGGKTAVNLPEGKNLVGTFHQPRLVLTDPAVLETLPSRDYAGGLAEVVKYGVIADAELFAFIDRSLKAILGRDPRALEEVVYRCASIKAEVVQKDEREGGLRAILNYGHTVGHAIEAVGDFHRWHHGEAVALGMEAAAFIAMRLGLASVETLAAQNRLLKACGLPTRAAGLPRRDILRAMRHDKKVKNGRLRFVLPERIGRVRHGVEVEDEVVEAALRAVVSR